MLLEKWYADVVTDGRAQVRYRAKMQIGPITVGYSARVTDSRMRVANLGARRHPMPQIRDGALHWPAGPDGPATIWRGAKHRAHQLLSAGKHQITWDPLVLNGSVVSNGKQTSGSGYAECLTLNLAPWHLGLDTLKWGRFCGQTRSLVWIEWLGRIPKTLALLDGKTDTLQAADRHEIRTDNARLIFGKANEIIAAPLGSGALAALGGIRMLAARRFLAGVETKWLAEARLQIGGEEADSGFVIYEEVVWP